MEVLIVVAIIGIIAAVAFPSYQSSTSRAYRADAQGALISLAASMESQFTLNNDYCGNSDTAGPADPGLNGCDAGNNIGAPAFFATQVPMNGGTPVAYTLEIFAVTEVSFEIRAVRDVKMAGDECGDFSYTHTGLKDQVAGTWAMDECW